MNLKLSLSIALFSIFTLKAQIITITVDTAQKKQTIRGLGCQADLETYGTNDDLLYDLGASSFRVFAGEKADYFHWSEPVNDNGDAATLDMSKFIFLPDADATTRSHRLNELRKAAKRNCTFYMTIGTPPCWMKDTSVQMYWMKDAGAPKNNCDAGGKLKTAMYDEFGEFAVGIAKKFKEDVGVDLYSITVNNEPEFSEPYYSCVYTKDEMVAASKAIAQKIQTYSMPTRIHYAEQTFVQGNANSWAIAANNDAFLKDYICAFAIHAYGTVDQWGGGIASVSNWTQYYAEARRVSPMKEIWMTEGGNGGGTEQIDYAFSTANAFYLAMEYGNASLYSMRYLNIKSTGYGINYPSYYGFKQFVRFIRPGSVRLATANTDTQAVKILVFENKPKGARTVYLVNPSLTDKTVKINWNGTTGKFDAFRTEKDLRCEWIGQYDLANNIFLPARSITTLMQVTGNNLPDVTIPDTIVIIKNTANKTIILKGLSTGGELGEILKVNAWSSLEYSGIFNSVSVGSITGDSVGITLSPKTNITGKSRLMIAISDQSSALDSMYNEKTISVPVYIIPFINKAPVLKDIADQNYAKSLIGKTQLLNIGPVSDGNDGSQKLSISVSSTLPQIATILPQGSSILSITPKTEGTATIIVTLKDDGENAGGGTGSISRSFTLTVGSGIYSFSEIDNGVFINPNPASGDIMISVNDRSFQTYSIADINGNQVTAGILDGYKTVVPVSSFKPGIYIIRVNGINASVSKKIFITE